MRLHFACFYLIVLSFFAAFLVKVSLLDLEPLVFPAPEMAQDYATYNREYFAGRLPAGTLVLWSRVLKLDNDMGLTVTDGQGFVIFLDDQMKEIGYGRAADEVLLHEMCHVAVFPYEEHGAPWQKCMEGLAKHGALRDLW